MDIAEFLVEKLKSEGISQSEFARKAGLTSGPVSRWMSRSGAPDLESCLKISAFFRESPIEVMRMAGREDLVKLCEKFDPHYVQSDLSEEDLYEDVEHRLLHKGLQRVLERGLRSREDVHVGIKLVQRSLDALLQSEQLFRGLVENADGVAWEADARSLQFTYVGPQAEKLLGYPLEDWYEADFWSSHLHSEDRDRAIRCRLESATMGSRNNLEYRMLDAKGGVIWCQDFINIAARSNGGPRRIQGFLFDVTSRREASAALEESEERYRCLVELSPDAIVVHREGKILYVNPAGVRLHGATSAKELLGHSIHEFIGPEDWPKVQERIRQAIEDGTTIALSREKIIRLDGRMLEVSVTGSRVSYQGQPAIQSILRDLSLRTR